MGRLTLCCSHLGPAPLHEVLRQCAGKSEVLRVVPPSPLSSRHQQLNLYSPSDQNAPTLLPTAQRPPGIINKWFLIFLFCFLQGVLQPRLASVCIAKNGVEFLTFLPTIPPGLKLHVCATMPGRCRTADQTRDFLHPTKALYQLRYRPSS